MYMHLCTFIYAFPPLAKYHFSFTTSLKLLCEHHAGKSLQVFLRNDLIFAVCLANSKHRF